MIISKAVLTEIQYTAFALFDLEVNLDCHWLWLVLGALAFQNDFHPQNKGDTFRLLSLFSAADNSVVGQLQ